MSSNFGHSALPHDTEQNERDVSRVEIEREEKQANETTQPTIIYR